MKKFTSILTLISVGIETAEGCFFSSAFTTRTPNSRPPREVAIFGASDLSEDYAKWDNLKDDDEDEAHSPENALIPSDMRYLLRNIHRQSSNYEAIRRAGGRKITHDVYLRSPGDEEAWLVGKIARISDVTPARAINRQYPLIERHAWALRPTDLHPRRGPFEVWYTDGNLELEVVERSPEVRFERVEQEDIAGGLGEVRSNEVGFRGVSYDEDEKENAIYARLTSDGYIFGTRAPAVLDNDMGYVVEKIRDAPTLESLLDDVDFQDLVDKME